MKIEMLAIWGLGVLLSLVVPAQGEEPAGARLSGPELEQAFAGAYLSFHMNTTDAALVFRANGSVSGSEARGGQGDTGKWWVEGDRMCWEWSGDFDTYLEDACYSVYLDGTTMTWLTGGGKAKLKGMYSK